MPSASLLSAATDTRRKGSKTERGAIAAGGLLRIDAFGDYFYFISASGAISVKTNTSPDKEFESRVGEFFPVGPFGWLELRNHTGEAVTFLLYYGFGRLIDNRFFIAGNVQPIALPDGGSIDALFDSGVTPFDDGVPVLFEVPPNTAPTVRLSWNGVGSRIIIRDENGTVIYTGEIPDESVLTEPFITLPGTISGTITVEINATGDGNLVLQFGALPMPLEQVQDAGPPPVVIYFDNPVQGASEYPTLADAEFVRDNQTWQCKVVYVDTFPPIDPAVIDVTLAATSLTIKGGIDNSDGSVQGTWFKIPLAAGDLVVVQWNYAGTFVESPGAQVRMAFENNATFQTKTNLETDQSGTFNFNAVPSDGEYLFRAFTDKRNGGEYTYIFTVNGSDPFPALRQVRYLYETGNQLFCE